MEKLTPIEETYHEDPRRKQGLARLALHNAFENTMSMVEHQDITREHAMSHMKLVASLLLPKVSVVEGNDV
ncbi:hypothetical protein [Mycolicibacterium sp. PDY-3]|uniref:hypothetical protein n=1 Tax=Mycolicibacterium sp. PDY-3 TaxID=3376069 RepID=UPI00378C7032